MADASAIEWTDSTFNPWIGCTKVGPGCDHCYAEALMDARYGKVKWGAGQPRVRTAPANWRKPLQWNREAFYECRCGWRGEDPDDHVGDSPACSRGSVQVRRRVFCASLADVFDNEVDPAWRVDLFELIARTPNLDWLLLTKRIGNVQRMVDDVMRARPWNQPWPWPNVWLGATVVNREEMLRDAEKLKRIAARVRFWSVEPMLGDLGPIPPELMPDWVIVGGESGHGARPMHPDWVRSLRDQCQAAGVPFLFKQWGEWAPAESRYPDIHQRITMPGQNGSVWAWADGTRDGWRTGPVSLRMGKKAAGRLLDGREWNGFPV